MDFEHIIKYVTNFGIENRITELSKVFISFSEITYLKATLEDIDHFLSRVIPGTRNSQII